MSKEAKIKTTRTMKLEIKHLAPYLPYSLKVTLDDQKTNVAWMSTKNIAIIIPNGIGEYEKIPWKYADKRVKPILRPLSDLTKEIEHNGVKFIPLDFLWPNGVDLTAFVADVINESCQVMDYRALLEWHFDVFGLIEKGLAINKNTI